MVDVIAEMNLPVNVASSLLPKIDGALSSIVEGNDNTATNKLQAFINAVGAQSGKKIPKEDADKLIEYAESIIDSL